ncbi:sce7725 family protein [Acinetobacter sp. NIPH 2699]|uniref:sce7725 family protein n=1 Tax=Acinetobacter sp. NIPH 2699 TaxID=2923433 RepID=UPI001F4C3D44|nr:sce7725 family protein [Acinetobacter sp. NIPH 2699]MCH7337816.1 sce7725 family protein [Acinetobacter sp. NIPH 2699]
MYYPILRGKLNELLALRELAILSLPEYFCPVIEPVREDLSALKKTIVELNNNNIEPIVIVNPLKGDFKGQFINITNNLNHGSNLKYLPCFILHDRVEGIPSEIDGLSRYALFVTRGVDSQVIDASQKAELTFVNHDISPNIIRRIKNVVLCGDFFKRQSKNADYPEESSFSSLHTYYNELGASGFSDYTITGEEFSESGGPAYVVTIHISYIDSKRFDEMFVRHYLSYEDGTPAQPGAKFLNALEKLVVDISSGKVPFIKTNAIQEFLNLNSPPSHFPGLGQVKKISIKHHIETLVDYLSRPREE